MVLAPLACANAMHMLHALQCPHSMQTYCSSFASHTQVAVHSGRIRWSDTATPAGTVDASYASRHYAVVQIICSWFFARTPFKRRGFRACGMRTLVYTPQDRLQHALHDAKACCASQNCYRKWLRLGIGAGRRLCCEQIKTAHMD